MSKNIFRQTFPGELKLICQNIYNNEFGDAGI
jgi:hypothetical protein